jgi:hypothetical protein
MASTQANATNPFAVFDKPEHRDDWEEWEDAEASSDDDEPLIDLDGTASKQAKAAAGYSQSRYSVQRPIRKSRQRQKAQNSKAGIKVVTDMSQFGRSSTTRPKRMGDRRGPVDETAGKFADASALKALEGSPTSSSIGSFSWLKQKPGNTSDDRSAKKSTRGQLSGLSPDARQIPIGIDVTPQQQRSVWSPDTDASESPYNGRHPASSVYSRSSSYGGLAAGPGNVPPVPTLPATLKFKQSQQAVSADAADDDDVGTPCTLFEEDGSPRGQSKSFKTQGGAHSRSGWWDHNIASPASQQSTNPFKKQEGWSGSSQATQDWWQEFDVKKQPPSQQPAHNLAASSSSSSSSAPSQQNTAPPSSSASSSQHPPRPETQSEKARILYEENQAPSDAPPPYSPPQSLSEVKYGPGLHAHLANAQRIPSPGPISPGLPGTMSSQGVIAINLAEIPLTPRIVPAAVLPDRPLGAYAVTGDHFHHVDGKGHDVERTRRRHEKEEAVARKVGGFWRGRGCIPDTGCFGRTGREGRKRRRVYLGLCGGILATIILAVVLTVVLTRKSLTTQASKQTVPSIWVNLTQFPPMPTGVLTVSGPDNSLAISGCVVGSATTAWSCSIPKDEQVANASYAADSPEFIFQVQFDNNTQALWKVANEEDAGFSPNPAPPSLAEMAFLGNTTDDIKGDGKAGEPTPFYISLISSVNATVGPNVISRRDLGNGIDSAPSNGSDTTSYNLTNILPAPALNVDGTSAPAKLFPLPSQQPARLFDRGLPTEHYGFYSYFTKTVYLTNENKSVAADQNGGALLADAKYLSTWTQTRFYVRIWTRMGNTTELLGASGAEATSPASQPGTMPYPVTIGEDLHGGDRDTKATFWYGVEGDQHIDTGDVSLFDVNRGFNGTLINPSGSANLSLGGVDGGTGGCKCQWVNFRDA